VKEELMRTGEDAIEEGLYASECCGVELTFEEGKCFCRCPRCQALCDWEIVVDWVDGEENIAA
jgi:hypothetical protein